MKPPHWPPNCTQDLWGGCVSALSQTEDQTGTRPRVCHPPAWKSVLTSWPHLYTDLQKITEAVWSSLRLQTLHHHPTPQETFHHRIKWPVALTSVVMKSFERLVLAHLRDITGCLLDALKFTYQANRSVDDATWTALYSATLWLHRDICEDPVCGLQLAFNAIIPDVFRSKLTQLSVPAPTCQWIINCQETDRRQQVRLTSSTWTSSTGALQRCVLSLLLFSLYNKCLHLRRPACIKGSQTFIAGLSFPSHELATEIALKWTRTFFPDFFAFYN